MPSPFLFLQYFKLLLYIYLHLCTQTLSLSFCWQINLLVYFYDISVYNSNAQNLWSLNFRAWYLRWRWGGGLHALNSSAKNNKKMRLLACVHLNEHSSWFYLTFIQNETRFWIHQVEEMWAALEFPVLLHKDARDVYVLGGLEEIQAALDESNIHISTILSSRNCGPIKSRVEEWAKNLDLFSKTLVSKLYRF